MGYNVFADMGLPNPEVELLKCQIVGSLRDMIKAGSLNEKKVASLWTIPAEEIPLLLKGRWEAYSVEQLFYFADVLNRTLSGELHRRDVAPDEEAKTLVLTA